MQALCPCAEDLDGSGVVDGADLGRLLAGWSTPGGDINGSGTTDGADLGMLLAAWGPCGTVPTNDLCVNALPIDEGTHAFCTSGAGTEPPPYPAGACVQFGYDTVYADIWYSYTATAFGTLTISTCGTSWDTRLAAYAHLFPEGVTTCPTSGFSLVGIVACNDDYQPCNLASQISFSVIPGKKYLIRVGGYSGFSGSGTLHVDFRSQGMSCEEAIDLGTPNPNGAYVGGTTLDNDPTAAMAPCAPGDTVAEWYRFIAYCPLLVTPQVTITTCYSETDFDTVLTVYKAGNGTCLGALVTCNDDTTSPQCQLNGLNRKSRVTFTAEQYGVYYIRVSGYQGAAGRFTLSVLPGCN